jgi:hypothetical protein
MTQTKENRIPLARVVNPMIKKYLDRYGVDFTSLIERIEALEETTSKDSLLTSAWIPAFAFLPWHEDSAYYVGAESPAYVFEPTTKSSVKLIFSEDQVIEDVEKVKIKFECYYDDNPTPALLDVVWEVSAGWYAGSITPTMGTAVSLTQTLDDDDEKTAISAASGEITIGGEKTTDDKFQVLIARDGANELDDLDANAFLTRVHFEFVTA